MRCIGFKLSETDIQTSAYAADGFIKRDNILIASQLAMPDIAESLRRQTEMLAHGMAQPPKVDDTVSE